MKRIALEGQRFRTTEHGPYPDPMIGMLMVQLTHRRLRPLRVFDHGLANSADLRLNEVTFHFPDLPPALDGLTLLHLSDIHCDTHPQTVDGLSALTKGVTVDVAVITGDFQELGHPSSARVAELLAPVLAGMTARHGIYGVLGNHDHHGLVDALEAVGVRMLVNEHAVVEVGGQRLVLTGVDDVHRFYTPEAARALETAPAGFHVALVHSPEAAGLAERAGVRLYLCGHTHGGQVCLPGGRPIVTALLSHHALALGTWRVGRMEGYTSRGIGVGLPPVRYNSRGEVALITLKRTRTA